MRSLVCVLDLALSADEAIKLELVRISTRSCMGRRGLAATQLCRLRLSHS